MIDKDSGTWATLTAYINARIAKLADELVSSAFTHTPELDANRRSRLYELQDLVTKLTKPEKTQ